MTTATTNQLTVGQTVHPTTSTLPYTVLAVCPRSEAGRGTYASCFVLHVNGWNSHHPFATHVAIDTPEGWAFEHGSYHRTLPEAYAWFVGRCPTQWAD